MHFDHSSSIKQIHVVCVCVYLTLYNLKSLPWMWDGNARVNFVAIYWNNIRVSRFTCTEMFFMLHLHFQSFTLFCQSHTHAYSVHKCISLYRRLFYREGCFCGNFQYELKHQIRQFDISHNPIYSLNYAKSRVSNSFPPIDRKL